MRFVDNESFQEILERKLAEDAHNEGFDIAWNSTVPQDLQPIEPVQNNFAGYQPIEYVSPINPDLEYLNNLCSQIHQKLDNLQVLVGREELTGYMSDTVKSIITDLIQIDTSLSNTVTNLDVMADTANNLAMTGQDGQELIINNTIGL